MTYGYDGETHPPVTSRPHLHRATSQVQACVCCLAAVFVPAAGVLAQAARADAPRPHVQIHADSETGAEVRVVWCPACADADPMLMDLAAAHAKPDDDPEACAEVWAIHERLHRRAVLAAKRSPGAGITTDMAAARAAFMVVRDSADRRYTFRSTLAYGVRLDHRVYAGMAAAPDSPRPGFRQPKSRRR